MLLFPDPFGPETVVKPRLKGMVVFPTNDLKLSISICWINTEKTLTLTGFNKQQENDATIYLLYNQPV